MTHDLLTSASCCGAATDAAIAALTSFASAHSISLAKYKGDPAKDRRRKQIGSTLSELGLIVPYDKGVFNWSVVSVYRCAAVLFVNIPQHSR